MNGRGREREWRRYEGKEAKSRVKHDMQGKHFKDVIKSGIDEE